MKILLFGLGDLYGLGGVQVSYELLLSYLSQRGHRVSFYSARPRIDGIPYAYSFPSNVRVDHYQLEDDGETRQAIRDIAVREDPDVILIVNSSQTALIQCLALCDLPFPVVLSERGGDAHNLRYNWFSPEQRAFAHYLSDFSHFLMPSYSAALPDWMSPHVSIIPSAIHPAIGGYARPGTLPPDGRYVLIYAGRLAFEKDVDILLRSFASLQGRHADWDLHVYGGGPDEHQLMKLSKSLFEDSSRVRFRGIVDAPSLFDAYRQAHLFALPSRAEGCPLALREAMAHGLPVIGFDTCSGVNEIIRDGENGLLATSVDKVAGLAEALERLMNSSPTRERLGQRGVEDVTAYEPAGVLSKWESLLGEAAQWKGARRELRRQRYQGLAGAQRFDRYLERLRTVKNLRNVSLFDPAIPLNNLEGVSVFDYALLFGSVLFDSAWYGREYPEVKVAGIRPLCHYLSEGYLLGNAPSKEFSPADYVARYMNGKLNQAPLVHYYRHGRHAGATLGDLSPAKLRLLQQERERDGDIQAIERETSPEDLARSLRDEITWRRALRDFGRRKRGASTERESKAAAGRPIAQRSPPASKSLVPPMVSIVVPTYNKREFLTDALKSAVDQSYGSIEVIVVDDGSTDGSGNVADAFASSHPAMRVVHQQNGGLSNARNRGIQEARGELIFFHDADDLMEPDAIANLVSVYEAHGSDVTGGVFRRRVAGQDRVVESFRKFEPELNFRHSIPLALHYATNLSSCNKLFRRSFLDAHGLRFADRLYMQDVDFWLRTMFLSENITQTAHVVATYVARPGSWSTQKTAGRFESLFDLFDRVANFFEENALAEFDLVRHFALIQAAIWFFAKWKLEEWPGPKAGPAGRADLRRIQDLLARIPAEHFTEFFVQKNKGIVVPTLLALRSGNFKFAKRVLAELPQQQYRQALSSNKAPSAEDLIAIAKNMLPDKVGVRQQNTSAELKS